MSLMRPLPLLFLLAFGWAEVSLLAAPSVSVITPVPGTTVSALTSVSVTFSEPVTGVAATDLGVNGELATTVTGSGAGPYVFSFPQPFPGTVSLGWDVVDLTISGLGTGEFSPTGGWSYTLTDTIAPTLGLIRTSVPGQELTDVTPAPGSTLGNFSEARVMFSENVTGVDAADLRVNGVPATAISGDSSGPYLFTFATPSAGPLAFTWTPSHGITDAVGNAFAGTGWNATLGTIGQIVITEFLAANGGTAVAAGSDTDGTRDENWDLSPWIELHNPGATSVNLAGWTLTDDTANPAQWVFPSRTIAAGGRLVVWASGKDRKPASGNLHTNFTLSTNGGSLALYAPDSPAVSPASSWLGYPAQRYDYSYGAQASDGAVRYFTPPSVSQGAYTPPSSDTGAPAATVPPSPTGVANPASSLVSVTPDPTASVSRGFFSSPFSVLLSCADATATIRYTLDGSAPLVSSTVYTGAVSVTGTTLLRFAAFGTGKVPSRTVTHTYLFPETVVNQPNPPYDNPASSTDNTNPAPPAPGGNPLPIAWGTAGSFTAVNTLPAFPTGTNTGSFNLTAGQTPADYGMDPKVWADPTRYNDAGAVDAANGKTNLERIRAGLRSLPALSLVINAGEMFGAYPNGTIPSGVTDPLYPTSSSTIKRDMTKPCSLELMQADGTTVFAVDAGVDLHGNASRDPFKNPKHGFTLRFKGRYGAGKLEANLFPDSPVRDWDKMVLRGDYGNSWLHGSGTDALTAGNLNSQRARGIRLREAFCKDTFRDMGGAASHHRFVNLFINGVFWGNYELMEDEAEDFGASYFGGNKDDFDVVDQGKLKSGNWQKWSAMKTLLGWTGGTPTTDPITAPTAAVFLSAFNNTQYESLRTYLDMPWFQDYMIHHLYFGHQDWATSASDAGPYMKNVYFLRPKNGTFKVMPWDMENLMNHQDEDRVTGMTTFTTAVPTLRPPAAIHPRAKMNPEYRLEFADRAWQHLIKSGGALTPATIATRFDKWTTILGADAMVLESARWGDYRYKVHQYSAGTYNQVYTWNGSWYDGTGAGFANGSWTGGFLNFNTGRTVGTLGTWNSSMANSWLDEVRRLKSAYFPIRHTNVLTQFRTNGLYPFLNAPELRDNSSNAVLGDTGVPAGNLVKLVMPTAGTGTSSAGDIYYTTDGTDPRSAYDFIGSPRSAATLYTTPFTVSGPVIVKARALAKTANFPAKTNANAASPYTNLVVTYNNTGGTSARGQITAAPLTVDGVTLSAGHRVLLKNQSAGAQNGLWVVTTPGTGATGVWDRAADWDDNADVVSGTWLRVTSGTLNQGSLWRVSNTGSIIVGGASGTALTFAEFSPWSALMEVKLTVGPPLPSIRITEINYNPRGTQGGSASEFIEFLNTGSLPVDMTSWSMDGVSFVFPAGFVLQPGNRVVIASNENPVGFAIRFPGVIPLGYFGGTLDNGGERLSLLDAKGVVICTVEYGDTYPWPSTPDNGGYALEVVNPDGDLQSPANWRASTTPNGTPGTAPAASPATVLLTEFFIASASGFAEVTNFGTETVDLANWSVNGIALPSVSLTANARAFVTFPTPLDSTQGNLILRDAFGNILDGVRYGPQVSTRSFVRDNGAWVLAQPTPGAADQPAATVPNPYGFNEVQANPAPGNDDWLEIRNGDATNPLNLTGHFVEVAGNTFRLTAPTAIAPASFVRLWCDAGGQRGDNLNLNLPAAGATLTLRNAAWTTVNTLTYAAQTEGVSTSRFPDGSGTLVTNLPPSPGLFNIAPPATGLQISEVLVLNTSGPNSPWASRPAWIELSNTSGSTENLAGWTVRTVGETPASWTFPAGLTLAAGAQLRLWCDAAHPASTGDSPNLNTGFGLAPASVWGLELLAPTGHLSQSLAWGLQIPDRSLGLAGSAYTLLATPTPGSANSPAATLGTTSTVRLNEWYGGDTVSPGNFVELHNSGSNPVDLGGLWLGDSPSDTGQKRRQIVALSFIAPGGHALFPALAPTGSPYLLGFDISKGGEYLRLGAADANATLLDEQNFPAFASVVSRGRLSDGTGNITTLNPTPGAPNETSGGQPITGQPLDVVSPGGSPASFTVTAPDATSWQWKRNGDNVDGAVGPTHTVTANNSTAGTYTCVVNGPNGTATSRAATLTVLNSFATFAQINGITNDPSGDPDNDGISNGFEFLLGTDPLSAATPAQRALFASVSLQSPETYSLGFDLALDPNATFTSLIGEVSPDISAPIWQARAPDSSTPIPGGQRLLWTIPAESPRYFLRLRLEE